MEAFEKAGVSLVIWANHMLRAAIGAMQDVANHIGEVGTARDLEDQIVLGQGGLPAAGRRRTPRGREGLSPSGKLGLAVVLAASRGRGWTS